MKYLLFFLCILLMSSCDLFDYDIKYEVTGTADTVNITYKNEDGGTSQANGVSMPWTHTFKAQPGDSVYLSAQNNGESGAVTVSIFKEGSEFKKSSSSGPFCIAIASGLLE